MAENKFSMSEAIDFGWDCMRKNFGFFAGLLILLVLFGSIDAKITKYVKENPSLFSFIIKLSFLLLNIFIQIGLVKISLNFASGKKGSFRDFLGNGGIFFRFIGATILYCLLVLAGFILLIVPGIIWAIQFGLYTYLIVDKDTKITESLKKSSEITQGEKGRLFLFYLVLCLINFAGLLCLIIGLFATIPTTVIAAAYVYKKLLAESEQPIPLGSETK